MGLITDLAERSWRGDFAATAVHPGVEPVAFEPLADGLGFMHAFANVTALDTSDGLVLLDVSSMLHAQKVHRAIRDWRTAPIHTALYTHGHVDHVTGLGPFEREQATRGLPPVRVMAHHRCCARFDRYGRTTGYNGHINMRQFGLPVPIFPTSFRYPDETIGDDGLDTTIGGVRLEIHHDKGETDDHLWVWLPEHRAVVTGDLFIWASPNCGNPQKVQRFPWEWACALRSMAARQPELLLPGHGPPIIGAARVQEALSDAAELLETIVSQTLELMNQGAELDTLLHEVQAPERLLARPYLRATYDEPEFIVRNLWRLYGGWYDGDPAHLKPAPAPQLAAAVADVAGGPGALIDKAEALAAAGDLRLACHFAQWASRAAPDDSAIQRAHARIFVARAESATSLMAGGVFRYAARVSSARAAAATSETDGK